MVVNTGANGLTEMTEKHSGRCAENRTMGDRGTRGQLGDRYGAEGARRGV